MLVERGRLTNGTTWHAAGLVSQVRGTHALTELARINAETYERVGRETGIDPGLRRVGSLTVARTEERFHEIRRPVSIARDAGIPSEIVDRERIRELWPAAVVDDLVGGVFFPDGRHDQPRLGGARVGPRRRRPRRPLRARDDGHRVPARTGRPSRDRASRRRAGDVEAEVVVLAGRPVDLRAGATGRRERRPLPGRARLGHDRRDAGRDARTCRSCATSTATCTSAITAAGSCIGAFEPNGKPWAPRACRPTASSSSGRTGTTSAPCWRRPAPASRRSADLGFGHFLRGPESFTPDANLQLGFVPEVPGLFVAAGLNSQGIIFGPGVGRAAAEWIVAGHMTMDLVEVDVARMGRWASQRRWLHERTVETLGGLYAMHWPGKQPETARGVRRLPLDAAYRAAGAAMGQVGGWERPLWFEPGAGPTVRRSLLVHRSVVVPGRPRRGPGDARGRRPVRPDDVREVRGRRSGRAGRPPAARHVRPRRPAGPGRLHDPRRRARRDPHGPDGHPPRRRPVPRPRPDGQRNAGPRACCGPGCRAMPSSPTSPPAWATLHLAGPRSRELLARLTDADVSADAWPFLEAREIEVGRVQALALRVSFTGELGWELLVPTEFVADLHEHVVAAGADLGLRHAGAFAFEASRLERGFRSWGHDMGPLDDPFAAGLGFAVSRRKAADFVGRAALERSAGRPGRGAAASAGLAPRPVGRAVARRVRAARRGARRPRDERLDRADPRRVDRAGLGPRAARWRRLVRRDRRRPGALPGQPRAVLRPTRGTPPKLTGQCFADTKRASGCASQPAKRTRGGVTGSCPRALARGRAWQARTAVADGPLRRISGLRLSWCSLTTPQLCTVERPATALSCGPGRSPPSGRRPIRRNATSDGHRRPCGRSARRRRWRSARAARRARPAARRPRPASAVNPKCSKIVPAGAEAPKWSSPMIAPSSPTQRSQPSDTPTSTLTRLRTAGGRTSSRYDLVLRLEPLPAGERHDARRDAVVLERRRPPRRPAAAPSPCR